MAHDPILLLIIPQLGQHAEVIQRTRVSGGLATGGDVAEQAAHDFSATGLGEGGREADC